ncbi:atypical membrane-integrating protein (Mistic protein) [Fredinandcohnia quinoae]|uniref:Atypical membrane-integrating protein (Mistic protein) n=1 Tax=Fredinandcohnia quinoae TaxID=2918902 RepID=A0AAW5E1P4_9BACI|nr:atypical membrane-integrating protein (Mistic protein) [Fredinandcohnia sp. SECRCQ15]MCH1625484.1 atypical membrane-integrating protein (Mistic protein) [Fredinandcohnia sp. SECRCQ15]
MKLNETDKKTLSDSIDKLNEGLDAVIQLYNDSEVDKPIFEFESEVIEAIEKAKGTFGDEEITRRINTIIKEVLAFLPKEDDQNAND